MLVSDAISKEMGEDIQAKYHPWEGLRTFFCNNIGNIAGKN